MPGGRKINSGSFAGRDLSIRLTIERSVRRASPTLVGIRGTPLTELRSDAGESVKLGDDCRPWWK
jgi:hypothetical protein